MLPLILRILQTYMKPIFHNEVHLGNSQESFLNKDSKLGWLLLLN